MAVKRYDGSAWQVVAGKGDQGTSSSISTWVKTASGGETSLSGNDDNSQSLSYTVGQELVFINGTLLKRGSDYTATNGTSITGLTALAANDVATVWTVNAFSVTGAIANTIVDAKGDLLVGTGADTPGRLAVGTNGQVLTAASTTGTGLTWATPSSGALTLLSSTSLSGGTTTISNISQDYTDLWLFCNDASISANAGFSIYFNSDTTATNYRTAKCLIDPTAIAGEENNNAELFAAGTSTGWSSSTYFWLHIPRYSVAENHYAYGQTRTLLSVHRTYISNLIWNSSNAITAISFANGSTRTWSSGTVRLYGVK